MKAHYLGFYEPTEMNSAHYRLVAKTLLSSLGRPATTAPPLAVRPGKIFSLNLAIVRILRYTTDPGSLGHRDADSVFLRRTKILIFRTLRTFRLDQGKVIAKIPASVCPSMCCITTRQSRFPSAVNITIPKCVGRGGQGKCLRISLFFPVIVQ